MYLLRKPWIISLLAVGLFLFLIWFLFLRHVPCKSHCYWKAFRDSDFAGILESEVVVKDKGYSYYLVKTDDQIIQTPINAFDGLANIGDTIKKKRGECTVKVIRKDSSFSAPYFDAAILKELDSSDCQCD